MPFSQLSLYYDADNNLRVIRDYTNSDNTGDLSTTLVTQPVIPLGGHAPKFEMRVVPSNNTYITQNDYANWRGLDVGVGYVRHRLEVAADANPGTINASTSLSVQVRRKAYHADQVSGNVIFNNTLTTEGSSPSSPQPTGPTDDAMLPMVQVVYPGQDFDTGIARVDLFLNYGNIRVRTELQGKPGYTANDSVHTYPAFTFDSNSPLPLNYYEASIELLNIYNNEYAIGNNSTTNHTSGGPVRQSTTSPAILWTQESMGGGGAAIQVTLRIIVRRVSDQVEVMRKRIIIETNSIN